MKIHRVTSQGIDSPGLVASKLPPQIVDRAVAGLCWISLFTAVTSILLTGIEHLLQPEFAKAWSHPLLRMASLVHDIFFGRVYRGAAQRVAAQGAASRPGMLFPGGRGLLLRSFRRSRIRESEHGGAGPFRHCRVDDHVRPAAAERAAANGAERAVVRADVAAGVLGGFAGVRLPADAAFAPAGLGAAAGDYRGVDVHPQ